MARALLALVVSASALSCAAWTPALAQPIHEPPRVVLIDPATIAPAPAPPAPVSPLTVQAAPGPKGIQTQARAFVQTYAAAANPELGQIARWHDGVCVQVVGKIAVDQANQIAARIQDVARSLNLRVPAAGCRSNVQIKFTDRPQDWLDEVAEKEEQVLGFHHPNQLKTLKTVSRPIQAWYMTATRGGAGDLAALAFANTEGAPPPRSFSDQQVMQEVVDAPENAPPVGCADSPRFTSCLKGVFKNVLVVADSRMVQGEYAGAVADYLAMLALSQPKSLAGCYALPSVLDLFAKSPCPGRDRPDGLTPADAAYLTALYSADLEAKKAGQQSDIARRMADILIKAHAVARADAEAANPPSADAKVR
jgi:hypothetical protein